MTQPRPLRADAVRNRKKIVDAARDQITLHGPDIGMDEIAAAAGVAVGTLYRHFPNKTDLVAAIVGEFTTQVADYAQAANDRVAAGARAGDEVAVFLGQLVEAGATNHVVKAAAHALSAQASDPAAHERASASVAALIHSGQADGDIHPDVTVDDIYLLFSTAPTDQPSAARSRWLTLVLPGLTTHARTTTHTDARGG